ncbi:unnamed protein product [Caenorhabditis angaria]|uniref:Serpin domain-containing protein n=1 Tax=Caenorhabditis angaria TaxID=860376 RepID=A0A9P1N0Q7_9PELO|nr:unnamed protein product [Caenorhabditis angaria]
MNSKTLSEESEENRSLSKFVRQRRKKSPNSTSKSKWNPFKKIAKIVTGASSTTTTSSSEPTDVLLAEDCVMRWTATCLNATCPIFAKNPQFNMTYCTIPSLLMFICVKFASEAVGAKFMDRLFELSEQDLAELAEICEMLQKCSTSTNNFYCFVRFLVDEEKTTTVSKELMAQCKKLTNQKVFASIRPSRAIKYLAGLSFGAPGALELSRPALLTTNGYGSCGLVAKWSGKTKSIGRQRFASTYHRMIMEPFFELSTKFRRISDEHFDVFEIDFEAGTLKNPGSLLIFRPHFIGNLPYSNRTIKPETIAKIMTKLENSERIRGTILLPEFCVTSNHDLWKNLLRQGVQPDLGQSQKLPPIASLHHWTSVCVNERGFVRKLRETGENRKNWNMVESHFDTKNINHTRLASIPLSATFFCSKASQSSPVHISEVFHLDHLRSLSRFRINLQKIVVKKHLPRNM